MNPVANYPENAENKPRVLMSVVSGAPDDESIASLEWVPRDVLRLRAVAVARRLETTALRPREDDRAGDRL